jgi:hypothetical protein
MDGESTGDPGEKPSGGDAPDRAPGADDVDSRSGNRPERGFDPAARLAERERRGLRRDLQPVERVAARTRRAVDPGGGVPAFGGEERIVFAANDRCDQENLIEQLKNGVRAMRNPLDNLHSNWAYMVTGSLAWTLKAWSALLLPVSPRNLPPVTSYSGREGLFEGGVGVVHDLCRASVFTGLEEDSGPFERRLRFGEIRLGP